MKQGQRKDVVKPLSSTAKDAHVTVTSVPIQR